MITSGVFRPTQVTASGGQREAQAPDRKTFQEEPRNDDAARASKVQSISTSSIHGQIGCPDRCGGGLRDCGDLFLATNLEDAKRPRIYSGFFSSRIAISCPLYPESGYLQRNIPCPLWANSGHLLIWEENETRV
jgi:hypothetical protein